MQHQQLGNANGQESKSRSHRYSSESFYKNLIDAMDTRELNMYGAVFDSDEAASAEERGHGQGVDDGDAM